MPSGCCWIWSTRQMTYKRSTDSRTKKQVTKYFPLSSTCLLPGTILVHCSAGVGRTGTFLAVFKLWLDYLNPNVKELSVFPTVLALRRQRCLMVQKKQQYAYIAKCLRLGGKLKKCQIMFIFQFYHQHRGRRLL